ncbi:transcriptional regulator with XRE-family HTH domain [Altererythrobacter atlanticus]|uniref:HTH-type transcriptional regulator PuuR n=1 Tax=Croceibacterium atlanticum TaxID=1267766 RepID=A0A0F7KWP1_9SPHN|nr:XRE family transcriptional regulator [Croceibacterium atlanticum]AKH43220.1 HTH-type transcriptional regulator PuuR [Croceibacterium atlanticum]MBB5732075.1 transcriptional regulator with XRE-family HTH domain [Croceibacterium atlanticum]
MNKNNISDPRPGPGEALRAIRAERGWTLADVHERTGLAVSTLSKLETGKVELNYTKLMKLSAGLGVDIAQLVQAPETPEHPETGPSLPKASGWRAITRQGEEATLSDGSYYYELHGTELNQRNLHPMVIEVKANSLEEFGEYVRHEGEEFTYVLEGSVEFHSEIYAPTTLNEGDSIYFDAGMGHAWIKASSGRCRILAVFTGEAHHHN